MPFLTHPDRITIRDVSARDGLQGEPRLVTTEDKVRVIEMLGSAGVPRINATSFVSPKAVPQMADAAEVMATISRSPGVIYDATVPNVTGAERAIAAGADTLVVFVSASEAASRSNVRRSTDEAMAEALRVIRIGREAGLGVVGTVSSAFGSPYGEEIPASRVREMAARFVAEGATGVSLGDTSGEADPDQVHALVSTLLAELGDAELSLHLHDTRGLALANAVAALHAGATHFDVAVGGIGGSPFTRNSAGNLAAEDFVWMCRAMGIETGLDLDVLLEIHDLLARLLDHRLPGRVGALAREGAS